MSSIVTILNQQGIKQNIKQFTGLVTFAMGAKTIYDAMTGENAKPTYLSSFTTPVYDLLSQFSSPLEKAILSKIKGAFSYISSPFSSISNPFSSISSYLGITKSSTDSTDYKSIINRVVVSCAQVSIVMSAALSPLGVWMVSSVVNRVFSSVQLGKVFGPNTTFQANWKHPRHVVSLVAVGFALPLVLKRFFVSSNDKKENYLQKFAIFTTLTSRPVFHVCNQLAQKIFKLTAK